MEHNITIGKHLQKARKKQNISLDQIIQQTKINVNVLRHLEEDHLEQLPSKTYVRGFVTSYAKAVGLDINEARDILDHTYQEKLGIHSLPEVEPITLTTAIAPEETETNKEAEEIKETLTSILNSLISKKFIYSLISIVAVGFILKGISNFFNQLSSESQSIIENTESEILKDPSDNLFDSNASKNFSKSVVSTTEDKVQTKEATQPAEAKKVEEVEEVEKTQIMVKNDGPEKQVEKPQVENSTSKEEEVEIEAKNTTTPAQNLTKDGKFPFKKFYPAPQNMYDIVENSPEASDPNLLPQNIKASALPNKQNVYIVATEDNTWISFKVDSEKIKRYVLKKGRSVLIKGDEILLFMGNFNATKVFLNNKLVSADTKTGVKSMIFPEERATNYELPLFPSFKGIPYSAAEYKENMAAEEISSTN